MKKVFLFAAIVLSGISCTKEAVTLSQEQLSKTGGISSDNSVNAVPISYNETSVIEGERWNPCSQEFVDFKGTGHTEIRGIITDNKITFVLHIN
jgi:hypothetical protein